MALQDVSTTTQDNADHQKDEDGAPG